MESSTTLMETPTTASGPTTKQTVTAFILTAKVRGTKATGEMTNKTAKDLRPGLKAPSTRATM